MRGRSRRGADGGWLGLARRSGGWLWRCSSARTRPATPRWSPCQLVAVERPSRSRISWAPRSWKPSDDLVALVGQGDHDLAPVGRVIVPRHEAHLGQPVDVAADGGQADAQARRQRRHADARRAADEVERLGLLHRHVQASGTPARGPARSSSRIRSNAGEESAAATRHGDELGHGRGDRAARWFGSDRILRMGRSIHRDASASASARRCAAATVPHDPAADARRSGSPSAGR